MQSAQKKISANNTITSIKTSRFFNKRKGVAMLPMVLSLSFIILAIVISLSSLSFIEMSIGTAQKRADEAYFIANSGISDAIIQIARNKNYENAGYSLAIGNGTVSIVVEKDVPIAGKSRITTIGTVNSSKRKIQVDVNVSSYGKVTIANFTEMP